MQDRPTPPERRDAAAAAIRWQLLDLMYFCEHEQSTLAAHEDDRLDAVLTATAALRAEIEAALAAFTPPGDESH